MLFVLVITCHILNGLKVRTEALYLGFWPGKLVAKPICTHESLHTICQGSWLAYRLSTTECKTPAMSVVIILFRGHWGEAEQWIYINNNNHLLRVCYVVGTVIIPILWMRKWGSVRWHNVACFLLRHMADLGFNPSHLQLELMYT